MPNTTGCQPALPTRNQKPQTRNRQRPNDPTKSGSIRLKVFLKTEFQPLRHKGHKGSGRTTMQTDELALIFSKRTHSGSWCSSCLCGSPRKLPNEPMRSARPSKVPSSRFIVVEIYETKPTDRMWAKRDRPRMERRVNIDRGNYETNPWRTTKKRRARNPQEIRGPNRQRSKTLQSQRLTTILPNEANLSESQLQHLRLSGERSQADAMANLPNEAMRLARRFKVPGSRFKVVRNYETKPFQGVVK